MKKIIVVIVLVGVLAIGALASTWNQDLFEEIKYNTFQIGMSTQRAEVLFSDYELISRITTEIPWGDNIMLSFGNPGEETLTLHFINNKLISFSYTHLKMR